MRVFTFALASLFAFALADARGGQSARPAPAADTPESRRIDGVERRVDAARRIRDRATAARQAARANGWKRGPRGFATYYAKLLDGRQTASGTIFDNDDLVAAHPQYPFGTLVRVTNLRNGRRVTVTIVDRGPVRRARASGVIIDLSRAAAEELDFIEMGRTRVRLEIREPENGEEENDAPNAKVTTTGARRTAAAAAR
jgi:rare lipoprotein A